MIDDPRDAATWGLINAADDEADTPEQRLAAYAPWIQQLTEVMTTVELTEADPATDGRWVVVNGTALAWRDQRTGRRWTLDPDDVGDQLWTAAPETTLSAAFRSLVELVGGRPAAPTREQDDDGLVERLRQLAAQHPEHAETLGLAAEEITTLRASRIGLKECIVDLNADLAAAEQDLLSRPAAPAAAEPQPDPMAYNVAVLAAPACPLCRDTGRVPATGRGSDGFDPCPDCGPAAEPPEMCNGGDRPHPFVPGIDEDDPDDPDPRWCNTCGESRTKTGVAAEPNEEHGDD